MALEMLTVDVAFDATSGITQTEPGTAAFSNEVRVFSCAIQAFNISYNNGDHHILRQEIEIKNIRKDPNNGAVVRFDVDFLLQDSSGNIDDPFSGWVRVLVIADVKSPTIVRRPPLTSVRGIEGRT